jgi:excisionase family DNA binding protein
MTPQQATFEAGRLLSLDQAAERLSITPRYLQMIVAHGDLPTVRIGRRRLVRVADLDAFVKARMTTRADAKAAA